MNAGRMMVGLLSVTLAGGCATVPREAGFSDVQHTIAERANGMRVHWNQGSASDAAVAERVNAMLAKEMSANEAVQVALLNNRALQATYESLSIAQSQLVEAGLLHNPVFNAEIKFAEGGGGAGLEMSLVQDFIDVLYIPLRKRLASAAFEAAKLRVAGEVLDLAGRVRVAFHALQASQQTLEMRRQVMSGTAASYELAQRLREAGNNRELDLANAQALFEQAKLDVGAAEANVANGRERLNRLMGAWGTQTAWTIASRLPDVPDAAVESEGLERQAIERSLDLEAARLDVERAARVARIVTPFSPAQGVELGAAAEREPDGEWAVGPAFSLPIPLFNRGRPAVVAARARLRLAYERYAVLAVEIRSRVRESRQAVLAAQDRVNAYQQVILPLRQRIVEETQLHFNAMQIDAFQLLRAKQEQIDASSAHIQALRDYWIARTELDLLLNGRMIVLDGGSMELMETPSAPAIGDLGGH